MSIPSNEESLISLCKNGHQDDVIKYIDSLGLEGTPFKLNDEQEETTGF